MSKLSRAGGQPKLRAERAAPAALASLGAKAVQVFFQIGVAVAVTVRSAVGRAVRIQTMRRLPRIGHAIAILIGWCRRTLQRRPTANRQPPTANANANARCPNPNHRIRTFNYRQFKFRLPPGHPAPLMHRTQCHPSLSIPQSTRAAAAAHQTPREHAPPRPRGQPQCTRSSSTFRPPEPL